MQLLQAGVDVFRINMAHGSRESHTQAVKDIRQASEDSGLPAGILVDLAGPKTVSYTHLTLPTIYSV